MAPERAGTDPETLDGGDARAARPAGGPPLRLRCAAPARADRRGPGDRSVRRPRGGRCAHGRVPGARPGPGRGRGRRRGPARHQARARGAPHEPPAAPAEEPPVPGGRGDAHDRRLPAADLASGDRAAPRRRHRERAHPPPGAASRPGGRPEAHAGPPGALRHDARVPRALRAAGPRGPPALRVAGRRGRRVRRGTESDAAAVPGEPSAVEPERGTTPGPDGDGEERGHARPEGRCRPSGSTSSWPTRASRRGAPPSD